MTQAIDRSKRNLRVIVISAVLAVLVLLAGSWFFGFEAGRIADTAVKERDAAESNTKIVAEENTRVFCDEPRKLKPEERKACEKNRRAAQAPTQPVVEKPEVPINLVQQAVARFCIEEACDPKPTQSQVNAAVVLHCASDGCGKDGKPGAKGDKGDSPPPPQDGRDALPPSVDELRAIVADYCADGRCVGPPATMESIAQAVSAYCADGQCGPTTEQITQAITAYCSNDACRGPAGTEGQPGTPGRGIVDQQCAEDGSWIFTYDREPITVVIPGPCRAVPGIPAQPPQQP